MCHTSHLLMLRTDCPVGNNSMPPNWLPLAQVSSVLGHDKGTALLSWLQDTVAQPQPLLGRSGPLCPFLPATLRRGLLFVTVASRDEQPEQALETEASRFLTVTPLPPEPASINKSLLLLFPDENAESLLKVVQRLKAGLIARGLTCGEFYPTSGDRSVRSDSVLVARSPVPMIALRYLTPHDRVFLSGHAEYGPLLEEWESGNG